jgi:hypothetical protein
VSKPQTPLLTAAYRRVIAGVLSLGVLIAAVVIANPATAATAAPPTFSYAGEVTAATALSYNPTGEFIFPSVFHAGAHLESPLGEWYLYYAPHENPGGISLMYADSLDGPWIEYEKNPVIANVWAPHYSVNHVSSGDAIWNTAEDTMFLYFHGGNDATRYATSDDGVTFAYGGVAVDNAMGGATTTETAYARVFEHPDPDSAFAYGMFYMENTSANSRRIRIAESVDGRSWTVRPDPIVVPGALDAGNVSAANLWEWGGQLYVIYHGSSGRISARPIDATLTDVGAAVNLHKASGVAPDAGRVASPEVVTVGSRTYLFYEGGTRLDARIAYAVHDAGSGPTPTPTPTPTATASPSVFDITRSVAAGCTSDSRASLTFRVQNASTATADIRVISPLGEQLFAKVPAGASRSVTFTAAGAEAAAGSSTVRGFARMDGGSRLQEWTLGHDSIDCGEQPR